MEIIEEKTKLNPYNSSNKFITKQQIQTILEKGDINYEILDLEIYKNAFIHKSYQKKTVDENCEMVDKPDDVLDLQDVSNERLEYLGDAVINLIVAKYLYDRFPNEDEGFMTRLRTKVVNGESLANFARKLNFSEFLIISKHVEEKCNGRDNMRILEDAFESFFGAILLDFNKIDLNQKLFTEFEFKKDIDEIKNIYFEINKLNKNKNMNSKIDKLQDTIFKLEKNYISIIKNKDNFEDNLSGPGFQIAEEFMVNLMEKYIYWPDLILKDTNYKDQLLRYFQQEYQTTPKYQEQLIEGPPHRRVFTMSVLDIHGNIIGTGCEKSKKKAEQLASRDALINFGIILED